MTLAAGLLAVLFAVVAQMAILPSFSIFGVQPNLVIVLLAAWMATGRQRETLLLIPAAGLLQGLLDSQPLGLAMLGLAPMILMTEMRELRLVESDLLPAVVVAGLATLVYETSILLSLAVSGERVDWLASVRDVLVPAAIANVLLLVPVYGLVRLTSLNVRRRQAF